LDSKGSHEKRNCLKVKIDCSKLPLPVILKYRAF